MEESSEEAVTANRLLSNRLPFHFKQNLVSKIIQKTDLIFCNWRYHRDSRLFVLVAARALLIMNLLWRLKACHRHSRTNLKLHRNKSAGEWANGKKGQTLCLFQALLHVDDGKNLRKFLSASRMETLANEGRNGSSSLSSMSSSTVSLNCVGSSGEYTITFDDRQTQIGFCVAMERIENSEDTVNSVNELPNSIVRGAKRSKSLLSKK